MCRRGRDRGTREKERERVSGPTRRLAKYYRFCRSRQPTSKLVRIAFTSALFRRNENVSPWPVLSPFSPPRGRISAMLFIAGVSHRCRSAPEVSRRFLSRADSVTLRRDGTLSILSGRGIMLHRRVNSEHFVRYFTCQLRNKER